MKDLILHSLKMHKIQTVSVMLSVAISVMALFALGLVYGGVQAGVQASAERSGAQMLVIPREAASELTDADILFTGAPAPFYIEQSVVDDIAAIDGVERVSAQFYGQTLDESCCSVDTATRLMGVDFSTDWTVAPFAHIDVSGGIGSGNVIVGASSAGIVGSTLTILDKPYNVVDQLDANGSELDQSIIMDIDDVRELVAQSQGLSYLWDKWGEPANLVSCILVDYADDADATAISRIENRIQASGDLKVLQRSDVVAESQSQLETVFAILLGAGVLMLASTLIQLFARFYSCVWDRKSELALYRALGANQGQLRKLIGGEVAAIVVVGVIVGLALGVVLYNVLLGMLQQGTAFPYVDLGFGADAIIAVLLVAVFAALAFLAIVVPLGQLKRLEPSLVMQQGDID